MSEDPCRSHGGLLYMTVPTYRGEDEARHEDESIPEWDKSLSKLVGIAYAGGLRLLLGPDPLLGKYDGCPDLLIERRPQGWAVIVHPDDGDASGAVYILDDGTSCVQPVQAPGATMRVLMPGEESPKQLDAMPSTATREAANEDFVPLHDYTILGVYDDNGQGYCDHVMAVDERLAGAALHR